MNDREPIAYEEMRSGLVSPDKTPGGPIELARLIAEQRAIRKAFTRTCHCMDSGIRIDHGQWVACGCARGRNAA